MPITSSITCNLQSLHLIESTISDEESYYFLIEYYRQKILHYIYRYPDYSFQEITTLVNNYAFFCARVKDTKNNQSYPSNFPIGVFRFMLHEDMSWSPYYTVRRKPGYVVEGAYWSNGMFYQVRDDAKNNFAVHEVTLVIDSITQKMHHFPQRESRE